MKKKFRKLVLHRETLRTLDKGGLRHAMGVAATTVAACISAADECPTWGVTNCGPCNTGEVCFCDNSASCEPLTVA